MQHFLSYFLSFPVGRFFFTVCRVNLSFSYSVLPGRGSASRSGGERKSLVTWTVGKGDWWLFLLRFYFFKNDCYCCLCAGIQGDFFFFFGLCRGLDNKMESREPLLHEVVCRCIFCSLLAWHVRIATFKEIVDLKKPKEAWGMCLG